jgi:hypothetical protein
MGEILAKKNFNLLPLMKYGNGKKEEKVARTCSMHQMGKISMYSRPIVFVNLNGK